MTTAATIPAPRMTTDLGVPFEFVLDVVALVERHGLGPEHGEVDRAVGYALTELRAFVAAVAAALPQDTPVTDAKGN